MLWQNQVTGLIGMTWRDPTSHSIVWTGLGSADRGVWKIAGVGDFDNNGICDIVWQNQPSGLVGMTWLDPTSHCPIWKGFGTMSAATWKVIGCGDYDGDGTSDVFVAQSDYRRGWGVDREERNTGKLEGPWHDAAGRLETGDRRHCFRPCLRQSCARGTAVLGAG